MKGRSKMKYGAYDPLYPNGIVTISGQKEIFGIRFLAADRNNHLLIDQKALDFDSIRIKPNKIDQNYDITWMLNGKRIHFSWRRISEKTVYGQVEFDDGLEILAEMYIPWEDRLDREWPNFTRQGKRVFAGELVSPYHTYENNAVLFCTDKEPDGAIGYNQRAAQLNSFQKNGRLESVARGTIWGDMGISWYFGAHYIEGFSFVIQNGSAESFLKTLNENSFDRLLEIGKTEIKKEPTSLTGNGIAGQIGEAISSMLPYNTIYKAFTGRRYIMVDRPWARAADDWGIQFNWDTFLSSWSASWVDPELAKENMLSGYDAQLPDGRIPLHIRSGKERHAEPPITAGRAQHIVQGLSLWMTYLHTGDKQWARVCYEGAKKANAWWFKDRGDGQPYRDPLNWGLLGFGYDPEAEMGILGVRKQPYVGKAQYAYFETYDDSPQWTSGEYFKSVSNLEAVTEENVEDEAKYVEGYHTANIYTLERCCLYAADCECLSKMAKVLGYAEDAASFDLKYKRMAENINTHMWCEEDGCYYNLKFDGSFSKKQSPDCFMPLMTGLVPEERKQRLLTILKDETKFWGEYMIPSIAKDDPAFPDQKYWRGQIWPTQTLWTYLSLKRANEQKLAWELAQKAGRMLAREWEENGFAPENYNAYTGRCGGATHYNWGVLMGMILFEELIELREDKILFGNSFAEDGTEVSNVPIDGYLYGMKIKDGKTFVYRDGWKFAENDGVVEISRDHTHP